MRFAFSKRKGFTLVEMLTAVPLMLLCIGILLTIIWIGSRLIAQNLSVNLAHLDVALPMQTLADDVHGTIGMPVLTGTLVSGSGVLPPGLSGKTTPLSGTMTTWSFGATTGSTAAGVSLYVVASSTAVITSTATASSGSATFTANYAGFPVASGAYTSTAKQISIELVSAQDKTLFLSATNGMHLCIPGAGVVVTAGTTMLDAKVTGVTFTGTASTSGSGSTSTLVANCTLATALGSSFNTFGTRSASSSYTFQAYLVAPVYYVVCGTDLVRLSCDGSWSVIMRNLTANDTSNALKPFSLPYASGTAESFLATSVTGRSALTVRFATTNSDYSNVTFQGSAPDMLLYDITLWSRMQLYDEISR